MGKRDDWTRINGRHRTRNTRKGLQARIADPLWMLCRQWQFGAFQGEDAASPIKTEMTSSSMTVQNIMSVDDNDMIGKARKIDHTTILEAEVEAENVTDGILSPRLSAEAGIQFLRGFGKPQQKKLLSLLQIKLPLKLSSEQSVGKEVFLKRLLKTSFDSARLYKLGLQKAVTMLSETGFAESNLTKQLERWRKYYAERFLSKDQSLWQSPRQEYRFAVQTQALNQSQITLKADAYNGGTLDWYHFDLWNSKSKNAAASQKKVQKHYLLPTPVRYSGMPADRFWNFEDGKVFFGGLSANTADLAQMLLTEFATVYSNDWYMLPLTVPAGSLSRIESLTMYDCFGEKHNIKPTAVHDGKNRDWRFFELSGDPSAEKESSPWLYTPRSLLGGQEDKPVEKVVFTRDEMANLAWGIEETLETQSGLSLIHI